MKIRIKSNKANFILYFPTGLIFNKTTAKIANTVGRKYSGNAMKNISPEALELFCTELGAIKKRYGRWELVKIQSANGDIVEIIL